MKEEVLKNCTVENNVVKLPEGNLDRKLFLEVKKSLERIGGKWKGGKVFGFVFNEDPTELLSKISAGEKINLKKDFQFFATPSNLADKLVALADVNTGETFLEPSAGQGAIVKAINRLSPGRIVDCYELMKANRNILKKINTVNILGEDFLKSNDKYDRIIANPPFSKNQDIQHIMHMYDCLNPKGKIVSIASNHWRTSKNKKETQFRNWLSEVNAQVHEIESGAFKTSGTNVSACIIVIEKII